MQTVYIETTIPSYLAARPSVQEPVATHQRLTREWWDTERHQFLIYSSFFVRREASQGHPEAAERRLAYLQGVQELEIPDGAERLEAELIRLLRIPAKAVTDASHLTVAILHRIDYLLTWNCTHLANAVLQKLLLDYCTYHKLHVPIVCTPETLISLKP